MQVLGRGTGKEFSDAYPRRFKNEVAYLRYLNIRSTRGIDSAHAFYMEHWVTPQAYIDYLPLTGGTLSGMLTIDGVDSYTSGLQLTQGYGYRHLITAYADGSNPSAGSALQFKVANDNAGGNVAVMTLKGSGFVGIGTTTPFTRLAVGSYVGIGATDDAAGALVGKDGLVFQSNSGIYKGAAIVGQQIGTYGIDLVFGTRHAGGNELKERLRITNDGNIGIGTGSPIAKAHIAASAPSLSSAGTLFLGTTATAQVANSGPQLSFGGYLAGDPSQNYNHAAIKGIAESSTTNINGGALILATANSSTVLTERLRISSVGNVGIGTTTPFTRLAVGSYVGIGATDDAAGALVGKDGLVFQSNSGIYTGAAIVGQQIGTYGIDLVFGTRHAGGNELKERLRITNDGNIGIGTGSPIAKAHIAASAPSLSSAGTLFLGTTATAQVANSGPQLSFGGYLAGDPSQNYNHAAIKGIAESSTTNINGGALILATANSSTVLTERLRISSVGNVGIGTASPSEKLSVNGNITAKKIIVTQLGWSDYVFGKDYKLKSLSSLESFIRENKHLPEVPSAKEVEEKGISVGDTQTLLLKKIEELTLYVIGLDKENKMIKEENARFAKRILTLEQKTLKKKVCFF